MKTIECLLLYLILSVIFPSVVIAVTPSKDTQPLASNGKSLFVEHCAMCHGNQGLGGIGLPLNAPEFINIVDDGYLKSTIQRGRPGRIMPAFSSLKTADVDAIVKFMRSWGSKKSRLYSSTKIQGNAQKGQETYEQHCISCHGTHGEGGNGTGVTQSRPRMFLVSAPALNNDGFQQSTTDALIKSLLINGHIGRSLPLIENTNLKDVDYDNLVTYIRSFKPTKKPAELAPTVGPPIIVRESSYDLQTTINNLKESIVGENFRLIRIQTLDQGFVEKGQENKNQVIVYSCAFNFLYDALKVDPRIGLFLPCRVTVVKENNKVKLMAINPKRMSGIFNNRALDDFCVQMYDSYISLMEDSI